MKVKMFSKMLLKKNKSYKKKNANVKTTIIIRKQCTFVL